MIMEIVNPINIAVQGELVGSGLLRSAASDQGNTLPTAFLQERYLARYARLEPCLARAVSLLAFEEALHDR